MRSTIFLIWVLTSLSSAVAQNFWRQTHRPYGGVVPAVVVNTKGHIFAGTDDGFFRSTNAGASWFAVNSGLQNRMIRAFAINATDYILAETYGTGVYRSVQPTTEVHEDIEHFPSSFALYQNYPNPFNPVTTIKYTLPDDGHLVLRVYDVLGPEVVLLVNELQGAGCKSVEFDASSLGSGVSFYRLQAGRYVAARKLVVLK